MKSNRSVRPNKFSSSSSEKRPPIRRDLGPKNTKKSGDIIRPVKRDDTCAKKQATTLKEKPAKPNRFIVKPVVDDDRRVYGIHAVAATLEHMPTRAKKLLYVERTERISPLVDLAISSGILVEQTTRKQLDESHTDVVHQGVMLMTHPFPYANIYEAMGKETSLIVILDEIEDPRNLGRAARSAFALGADLIVIPTNRAASVTASAEKASVGALSRIPVAVVTNLNQTIQKLKKAGFWVVGAAGEAHSHLWSADLANKTALVIGSEESGLRKLVRENCDELVKIPMSAPDMSLNAADALTILLYEAKRQREIAKNR